MFQLKVFEKPGYLHFRVGGENTPAVVRDYLATIHRMCSERDAPASILIEENLAGPGLPLGEIHRIASAGGTATAPVIRTIAYVDVNPQHRLADMQFAETVAVTRGINIRVFATVTEAEDWLREQTRTAAV